MLSENLLRSISPPQTHSFSGLPFSGKSVDTPQWSRLEISGSSLDHPHLPHLNKRKDTILPRRMIWGLSLPPISSPSSPYPVPWHRAPYISLLPLPFSQSTLLHAFAPVIPKHRLGDTSALPHTLPAWKVPTFLL